MHSELLDINRKINTSPYLYRKEKYNLYFLGNTNREFVACSKTLVDIIDLLKSGQTISQVSSKLGLNQDVVIEGVSNLAKYGFLELEHSDTTTPTSQKPQMPLPNQKLKLLTRVLLFLSVVSVVIILFTFMLHPQALPTFDNFFWSKRISIDLFTFIFFSFVTLLLHEFSHFVFAKAEGLDSSFSISNRLNYLVVETNLKDIYLLKRWDRLLIYLSGTCVDVVTIGLSLMPILYLYSTDNIPNNLSLILLLKQFIIVQVSSILWEFLIYMKTDIYFVLENVLGIYNLIDFSKKLLLNTFRNRDLWEGMEEIRKRERGMIFTYCLLFIFGTSIALIRYVIYHIPISLNIFFTSVRNFNFGILNYDFKTVVDAVVTFGIEAFYLSLLAIIIFRKFKTAKA